MKIYVFYEFALISPGANFSTELADDHRSMIAEWNRKSVDKFARVQALRHLHEGYGLTWKLGTVLPLMNLRTTEKYD